MHSLIAAITAAERRIRPHVLETPLISSPVLSQRSGAQVFLKLENRQHTGSFKLRGATNKLLSLSDDERRRGIVTASTGNHGLAVARAASQIGVPATIYLPENAAPQKIAKLRRFDVALEFYGTDSADTEAHARQVAEEAGRVFVSPYNDPRVVAGQGTIAVELLRRQPELDAVFVAVGGGGLIGGMAGYVKESGGGATVVGCLPENSPVMLESIRAGRIVEMPVRPTLSDGTAGGIEPGAITFELCRRYVDEWVTVSEDEIRAALRLVHRTHGERIEGAAGVAVASLLKQTERLRGQRVAVVVCGGNIDEDVFRRVIA